MEEDRFRIIHVATALSWRGGEQQVAYLLEELDARGIEQMVVCSAGSAMETYCKEKGYYHLAIKKKSSFDPAYAWQLKKAVRRFSPDLMHLHDAHAHTFAVMAATFFGCHVPLVLSRRVDFPVRKGWLSFFKYNHPLVKKIICVSHEIERITAKAIRNPSKLCTIHSGIDSEKFSTGAQGILRSSYQLDKTTKLIGNTSAIADHKDYFTFVDTAELLLESGEKLKFFIIGDGPDRKKIEAYVKEKGLEKEILFTGFRKDVAVILPELDIFLMTSKTEGLGTSLLDALAAAVPVVATQAGGIPEIIRQEETGLLAGIGDAAGLAAATKRLLEQPSLYEQLKANGREYVKNFSRWETAEKTLKVYREVITAFSREKDKRN